jgi:hypothetical protein
MTRRAHHHPRYAANMPKLLTPMFKFYPQDYLMKTATLTLEEQAALMRLPAETLGGPANSLR